MVRKILREWVAGEKTLPEAVADWRRERTPEGVLISFGYFLGQGVVISLLLDAAAELWRAIVQALSSVPRTEAATVLLLAVVTVQLAVLVLDVRRIAERTSPYAATTAPCGCHDEIVESTERAKAGHVEQNDERHHPERRPPED